MRSSALPISLALLLTGCSLAPAHVRPEPPVSAEYPSEFGAGPVGDTPATSTTWQELFADERLELLIGTALDNNRDMAIAVAQIEEARGFYRIQGAERFPTVGVSADAARIHSGTAATPGGSAGGGSVTYDRYSIGVGTSMFELDFWGRVRNLSEAARAQYLATVHGQQALRLALIRQVSATYLAVLETDERIRLAEATVASREEGLQIAGVRFEAGITSGLDYRQAESLLTQAEAQLAGLRLTRARLDNAMAVLVGRPLEGPLPEARPLDEQLEALALAPGLPSELLVNRPDILAAEEQLRAARANIGAARAAFLPSISLTGSFGYASTELSSLVGSDGMNWNFGPSVNLPIFDGGRRRGNLAAANAREEIALANYERAIQVAFREVADALAGRRFLAEQVAAQERGTQAQREIAELARIRYDEGAVGYIEVLDAERNLFAAEQALLQLQRAEIENIVGLYVALGGL